MSDEENYSPTRFLIKPYNDDETETKKGSCYTSLCDALIFKTEGAYLWWHTSSRQQGKLNFTVRSNFAPAILNFVVCNGVQAAAEFNKKIWRAYP